MELVDYNAGRTCLGQSYPPGFTNDARNNLSMELVDYNAGSVSSRISRCVDLADDYSETQITCRS
jgi:hypothetical protein